MDDSLLWDVVASLVNFPPRLSVMEWCTCAWTCFISLKVLEGHAMAVASAASDISDDLSTTFMIVHENLESKMKDPNTLEHLICP